MPYSKPTDQFDYHFNQIKYLLKPSVKSLKAWSQTLAKKYLYEQPWTLVIGTAHSGKTAFLQQAELNMIQGSLDDNTGHNTWFNQEGVFIELPSLGLDNLENVENNVLIQHFLQSMKKHRHKKPFDNILLTINLIAFIHEYDRYMEYLEHLKNQLQKILSPYLSKETGIYIVFTHMDRVAGFCDFFADFSTQYPTQTLGYLLEDYSSKKKLIEQHEKKYDRLLTQLHENLVSLLHKTRNNLSRYLIREFPQQLDSLRNMVRSSLSSAAEIHESTLKVKGVFFTSACQSGLCIDRLTLPISQSYQLTLPAHFPQAHRTQPYFIKGIAQTIAKDTRPRDSRFARYQREHTYIAYISSGIVALGVFFLGFNYYASIQHLNHATKNLKEYQTFTQKFAQDNTIQTFIPELNYLANAEQTLGEIQPWFFPFKNFTQTKEWINTQYVQTLSQQFLPQLAHQIEDQLLHETNPAAQYAALKAYLMLGEPQKLNLHYLKNWLNETLHLSSEKTLTTALRQPFPSITLNKQIIDQVRSNLNALPLDYFIYLLSKNNSVEFFPFSNNAFNYPLSAKKGIPNFYTRMGFEKTYNQTIPQTIQTIIHENWVLKSTELSEKTAPQLIQKIHDLYVADYLNWWHLFIYHTQPKLLENLDDAASYFKELTQNQPSPLVQMLTFIQSNTRKFESDKSEALQVFNAKIASQLNDINAISSQSTQIANPIFEELNRYFTIVTTSNEKENIIFNTAKQKFAHPEQQGVLEKLRATGKTLPAPMNQWLNQIAGNTWLLILSETKNVISQEWKKQILPEYTQNIAGRFPFNTYAEQEIALDSFSHFFNARGTLSSFFEEYIKPFLNTDQAQWVSKKVDNATLSFTPETILALERANVIRAMFFAQNSTLPSVRFTLQSTDLQPVISRLAFDINGQTLVATQNESDRQTFTWPGDYTNTPVTLTIQSISGENFQATEYGAWGFFRLLSHANVFSVGKDTRKLEVILDVNGNAAQYLLQTANPVNPFIPNILQSFELSEHLF